MNNKNNTNYSVKYHQDLIAIYDKAKENIGMPNSVLHPSCNADASPSRVFDNVTYLDKEEGTGLREAFNDAGLKFLNIDINDYHPEEKHDLVILLNPEFQSSTVDRFLGRGGYILTNDYHYNATDLIQSPDKYTLVAGIKLPESSGKTDKSKVVYTKNINNSLGLFKSEEEMKNLNPKIWKNFKDYVSEQLEELGQKPQESLEESIRLCNEERHRQLNEFDEASFKEGYALFSGKIIDNESAAKKMREKTIEFALRPLILPWKSAFSHYLFQKL